VDVPIIGAADGEIRGHAFPLASRALICHP
jgi:hypothetical protein